jgi:diadenosine tetraphosphatase ApaH/serine/threonine PP2A family protein phosphatase
VVEWTRANVTAVVRGNHDKAGADLTDLEWFNPVAQAATIWTHHELTAKNTEYVRGLAPGPLQVEDFTIVHGSPLNEDEYLVNVPEAAEVFAYQPSQLVFFGHTHLQGGFQSQRRKTWRLDPSSNRTLLDLDSGSAYLVNPGSVGQPRDENPEAAFVIFDSVAQQVAYHRAPYDIEKAQAKIRNAGLPGLLADRLAVGR